MPTKTNVSTRPLKPLSIEHCTLPIERADWDALLADWNHLIPSGSSRWLMSCFGELFFEQEDGRIGMLQISAFNYQIVAENKKAFRDSLVDPDNWSEWFLKPLLDQLEASEKILRPDTCYSFITPLGLGGELSDENVMIIPITEHFKCWGDVYQQIKDLPEGTRVTLKVQ